MSPIIRLGHAHRNQASLSLHGSITAQLDHHSRKRFIILIGDLSLYRAAPDHLKVDLAESFSRPDGELSALRPGHRVG